jgi:hypothetical protein
VSVNVGIPFLAASSFFFFSLPIAMGFFFFLPFQQMLFFSTTGMKWSPLFRRRARDYETGPERCAKVEEKEG